MEPQSPLTFARNQIVNNQLMDRAVLVWMVLVVGGIGLASTSTLSISVAILAIGFIFAVWEPVGAVAALMTAIPFVYQMIPVGTRQFSPIELAIIIGASGVAVRSFAIILRQNWQELLIVFLSPLETTLVATAVGIAGIVSLFFVADPQHLTESLREFRTVIFEPLIALLLIRWTIHHRGWSLLLISLVGTGAFIAIVAGWETITRTGGVIGDQMLRARGPYPHPNNLAFYLERIVLLTGGIVLATGRWRSWIGIAVAVTGIGLTLTFSRGAILALIAGGALMVLIAKPRRGWRIYGSLVVCAVALFAVVAEGRLFATGTAGMESSRMLIWRSSINMIRDHPWTGVGLDQFYYQYMLRYVSPAGWPERYTSHPHNAVLDVWLSLGVLGLIVFMSLVVIVGRRIAQLKQTRNPRHHAIAIGAAAALVGGLAHGMVDNSFFLPDLAVVTWLFIALLDADIDRGSAISYPNGTAMQDI